MTFPRYPNNLHPSYTVQRETGPHHHAAETPGQGRVLEPRMDVFEDPVTNIVTATFELPGVSRDKIAIDVFDNQLTISGEVASFFGTNYGYILRERRTGPFVRTLQLPVGIPVESIQTILEDGVLTVSFPRLSPEEKP